MIGVFVVRCWYSQFFSHTHKCSWKHIYLCMALGINILQCWISGCWWHCTSTCWCLFNNTHINSFSLGDCFKLISQTITYRLHMFTVCITADSCAKYCLWKIIAYIQSELTPYFFFYVFSYPVINSACSKKCIYSLYSLTLIRLICLAKYNTYCCFRIKIISTTILMWSNLYKWINNVWHSYLFSYYIFTVNTIHKAHYNSIFSYCRFDTVKRSMKCSIF